MQNQTYKIPYSKSALEFPTRIHAVTVAVSQPAEPLKDISSAIKKALDYPLAFPTAGTRQAGDRVCMCLRISLAPVLITCLFLPAR